MKLNTRFIWLQAGIFLLFAAISWHAFVDMVGEINLQWGEQFTERQVLFDKYRTLSPLIREIRLARQMAAEPAILQMALHEDDPEAKRKGIKAMEAYRFNFRDHSYFAAFTASGHYYFNDAAGHYSEDPYRYTLSPDKGNDKWFYATLKEGTDYQVNLDPDTHLGVTKVWINVLLKDRNRVIGVIGTGIDLTEFLTESVGINQPGVENFFVDKSLAIQLSTDPKLIDYASIAKDINERIKIDVLFKDPQDVDRLRHAARQIETEHGGEVTALWVNYRGKRHLLGMAYLPEIGWYDLTLIDEKSMMLLNGFAWLPVIFVILLLASLMLLHVFLRRWMLTPILKLQAAMQTIRQGNYEIEPPRVGVGEVAALSDSFAQMVQYIRQSNNELEGRVRERTEELQRLSEIDPLTGLLNRRGMTDRFEKEFARKERMNGQLGLLLLDLDHFKQINDKHGHTAGDLALCATANVLQSMKRGYDYAGRWGGEEFLVLLPDCSEHDLMAIAERIRDMIQALRIENFSFTASIGAHHSCQAETLDAMLQRVDLALYAAKNAGRNCVRLANAL